MIHVNVEVGNTRQFVGADVVEQVKADVLSAFDTTVARSGRGNDFLGWIDLPKDIDPALVKEMQTVAAQLKQRKVEVFVVIGIGGSYLGARAVIEALGHSFAPYGLGEGYPVVIYAGHNLDEDYVAQLLELLDHKNYAMAVISKSGTTTEPAIAFRLLKKHCEAKYGKADAKTRIFAITDRAKGALKGVADMEGYPQYVIPDDVGGRYSVLTPVGLLPIAVAGFDIAAMIEGANAMRDYVLANRNLEENPVLRYVVARNSLYRTGKKVEILVNYRPTLVYFTEWWKQLYGESEGKENRGIFPAGVTFTSDLHSMGQYIQEGERQVFETVLSVEGSARSVVVPNDEQNADGLNFLAGKHYKDINAMAELGTILAHVDGGVPNIRISVPQINERILGELIYFFEFACAVSGYTLGVNPFDQPGVEAYKKNMFALLNKPGYEAQSAAIRERVKNSGNANALREDGAERK